MPPPYGGGGGHLLDNIIVPLYNAHVLGHVYDLQYFGPVGGRGGGGELYHGPSVVSLQYEHWFYLQTIVELHHAPRISIDTNELID